MTDLWWRRHPRAAFMRVRFGADARVSDARIVTD